MVGETFDLPPQGGLIAPRGQRQDCSGGKQGVPAIVGRRNVNGLSGPAVGFERRVEQVGRVTMDTSRMPGLPSQRPQTGMEEGVEKTFRRGSRQGLERRAIEPAQFMDWDLPTETAPGPKRSNSPTPGPAINWLQADADYGVSDRLLDVVQGKPMMAHS